MEQEKKYKIIFVDIDWTILNHKIHDWDYESLDALKKAQENGVLVYLCTARPYDSVLQTGLFDIFTPDGIVSTNGEVAFDHDKLIFSHNIPRRVVRKVNKIADKYNLVVEMCSEKGRCFTKEPNEYVRDYLTRFTETIPEIKNHQYNHISAMLLFAPEELDAEIHPQIPNHINYFRFDKCGVDLRYHECSKGLGIKETLKYLGIKKEESIGIGDDYGDIPMFEEVGLSIAVGNGKDEVKDKATYIAETIHEHGVKLALEDLQII